MAWNMFCDVKICQVLKKLPQVVYERLFEKRSDWQTTAVTAAETYRQ